MAEKRKYDSTVARIAGNILSNRDLPDYDDERNVTRAVKLARAIVAEVERIEPTAGGWQPIEHPPDHKGPHSLRVYGWGPKCGYVFAQYTPFYLGHPDEHRSLWICENWAWAMKPTHWQPLPSPPQIAPQEPTE